MRKLIAILIATSALLGPNLASAQLLRYMCSSADQRTLIRVFPTALVAHVLRLDGRPPYVLRCDGSDPLFWLMCNEPGGRRFVFDLGGASGTYFGSIGTTPVSCVQSGGPATSELEQLFEEQLEKQS